MRAYEKVETPASRGFFDPLAAQSRSGIIQWRGDRDLPRSREQRPGEAPLAGASLHLGFLHSPVRRFPNIPATQAYPRMLYAHTAPCTPIQECT